MVTRLVLFLWASIAFAAPSNTLTISVSSAETGHPVTFGRPFAQGEIAHYPQPLVNGTATAYWQADQVQRYRDGKATCAITAVTNTSAPMVTCASHGFWSGDLVTISGSNLTALNGTHYVVYQSRDQFVLPRLGAPGVFSGTATAAGPGPGSVKWARISYISNSQNQAVSFADSQYRTSDPNYQSPAAADLLAFNGGNWNAGMKFEATGANPVNVDAKTMISAGNYWLWADGPALWEVVAEDRSSALAYDFEFACATGCNPASNDHSTCTWTNGSKKQIHPRFTLKMYRGWPGVGIEYLAENANINVIGDTYFSLVTFQSGASLSASRLTYTGNLWGMQRWIAGPYWDGAAPAVHSTDKNLAYLSYTKQAPNYYRGISLTSTDVDAIVAAHNPACGLGQQCDVNRYMQNTGGRPDLGPNPRWWVQWLYSSDTRMDAIAWDNARSAGSIPWHRRETTPSKAYLDLAGTGDADGQSTVNNNSFFRPVSMESRPSFMWNHDWSGGDAEDRPSWGSVYWPSGVGTGPDWNVDVLHPPDTGYLFYLLTGEYFALEEIQFEGSYTFSNIDPNYQSGYTRNRYWGVQHAYQNDRATAWIMRSVLYAASLSPDNSMEQEYFRRIVDRTLQIWEGYARINGLYRHPKAGASYDNPCSGSQDNSSLNRSLNTPYCFGQSTWFADSAGFLGEPSSNADDNWDQWCMNCSAHRVLGLWQRYFLYTMAGIMGDHGWRTENLLAFYSRFPMQFQTAESNRYLCCVYNGPVWKPASGATQAGPWPRSPKEFYDLYDSNGHAKASWNTDNGSIWGATDLPNSGDGYTHYFRAATSYMTGYWNFGLSGWSMWDNMRNDAVLKPYYDSMVFGGVKDPRFALEPRPNPVKVRVIPGDTFVILEYAKPRADQSCTVDGVSDGATNSRLVRFVKTGLPPSTQGSSTIHCASDTYGDTTASYTTTAALSGTGIYRWTAAGPNTRINYGTTAALGASTGLQDCAVQCSAELPKGLQYVQLERAGGAVGAIMPVLIR